jgi:hypothetical protein
MQTLMDNTKKLLQRPLLTILGAIFLIVILPSVAFFWGTGLKEQGMGSSHFSNCWFSIGCQVENSSQANKAEGSESPIVGQLPPKAQPDTRTSQEIPVVDITGAVIGVSAAIGLLILDIPLAAAVVGLGLWYVFRSMFL